MEIKGDLFRHLKMDISKKEIQSKIQENTLGSEQGVSLDTKNQQKNAQQQAKDENKKPQKNGAKKDSKLDNQCSDKPITAEEKKVIFLKKLNLF